MLRYVALVAVPFDMIQLLITMSQMPLDINDEALTNTGIMLAPDRHRLTTMTGAIHTIRLRQIWSKFNTGLFPTSSPCSHNGRPGGPPIDELRQQLEIWRATAPVVADVQHLSSSSVFASQGWFEIAYCHSILLLYRHHIMDTQPYKGTLPSSRSQLAVDRALEDCYSKAKDICLFYRRLYQKPSVHFTWGSLHMLFSAGLTYLYCLWRSESIRDAAKQREVVNTCTACQTVLVIIAERWKLATSYRDLFEALSERTISMLDGDIDPTSPAPNAGDAASRAACHEPMPPEDWISNFDGLDMPPESEWMISELFRGVADQVPDELGDFASIGTNIASSNTGVHMPALWNNAGVTW
jgi:hypothetical protein